MESGLRGGSPFCQLIDDVHALGDLAPDGVLIVKEASIVKADEELAVGAVRLIGPRH